MKSISAENGNSAIEHKVKREVAMFNAKRIRVEAWDDASNGAFTQSVWVK